MLRRPGALLLMTPHPAGVHAASNDPGTFFRGVEDAPPYVRFVRISATSSSACVDGDHRTRAAQGWSRQPVSVLLDTYLGVIRGDEAVAMERFEALLSPKHDDDEMVTRS